MYPPPTPQLSLTCEEMLSKELKCSPILDKDPLVFVVDVAGRYKLKEQILLLRSVRHGLSFRVRCKLFGSGG